MRKIPIQDASDAELAEFARNTLGLNVPGNITRAKLVSNIEACWSQPHIALEDGEAAPAAVESVAPPVEDVTPGHVKVFVNSTEEAGGSDPIPVGVNGKVMLVPRDAEVEIPVKYYLVLRNANAAKYKVLKNERGDEIGLDPNPTMVPLYPVQLRSALTDEMIEEAAQDKAA